VLNWCSGKRSPPPGVLDDLIGLKKRLDEAADQIVKDVRRRVADAPPTGPVEIWTAPTDEAAQARGLPCAGAHVALIRRVIEALEREGIAARAVAPGESRAADAAAAVHDGNLRFLTKN